MRGRFRGIDGEWLCERCYDVQFEQKPQAFHIPAMRANVVFMNAAPPTAHLAQIQQQQRATELLELQRAAKPAVVNGAGIDEMDATKKLERESVTSDDNATQSDADGTEGEV